MNNMVIDMKLCIVLQKKNWNGYMKLIAYISIKYLSNISLPILRFQLIYVFKPQSVYLRV